MTMVTRRLQQGLILSCCTLAALVQADSLWTIDIDLSPAPSPEDGPPFSAHAGRNLELLPYQIVGIVGSYLVAVLLLGTYTMTIARTMRIRTQEIADRPVEMVKPSTQTFDPSPVSPNPPRSWLSPRRLLSQKSRTSSIRSGRSQHQSPTIESVASFDNEVLEANRLRRQDELERLYAAVMEHDERRAQLSPVYQEENHSVAPPQYRSERPLTVETNNLSAYQSSEPKSPAFSVTPKSPARSMYPTSPVGLPASPGPGYSQRGSAGSKKIRKSLRSLKINQGRDIDDNSDGARTPLSPREYFDPGIPPEPPTARTFNGAFPDDKNLPSISVDEVYGVPRPYPSRGSSHNSTHPTIESVTARAPAASVNNPLPFRQMAAQQRLMHNQRGGAQPVPPRSATSAAFPLSPTAPWNFPASAGPVKTTFLEARRDHLGGGLRTGAATPYSPYMPFTPITPVTPYLPSRRERKQREKEERATHGVLTEEDEVQDDKDMWGSGY